MRRMLVALAAMLTLSGLTAVVGPPTAQAFSRAGLPVEYLDVYSSAMGRSIRVEFQAAGGAAAPTSGSSPKAVYLLDGLRAQDDYSGWDINTPAFEWFNDSGISVVMPVGGQSSFYTDWYSPSSFNNQTYTYKWETFLTQELPAWLSTNKQISPTGNGVVGLSMSGGAALILSAYHPAQFTYAASLSGFLNPSAVIMRRRSGSRCSTLAATTSTTCGDRRGIRHGSVMTRSAQVSRIVANGTRLWIYCAPGGATALDAGADPSQALNADGLEGIAVKSNKDFQAAYIKAGGSNATFQFPAAGNHAWPYWAAQLQALKSDLITTLNG